MKTTLALIKCTVVPTCLLSGDEREASRALKPLALSVALLVAGAVCIAKAAK